MTRVLILGGGGMVGQKLAAEILATGLGEDPAPELTLFDTVFPASGGVGGTCIAGDIANPETVGALIKARPDVIFHLAAIVSGEAEQNFDKGWQINMTPMWTLLEALRAERETSGGVYLPRLVFTSSIAVFGGPYPEKIDDDFLSAPRTSYGAQKATCELMLSDFTRKGYVDGISLRLPTICVRPGKPNAAASGFFSGIIREPLNGVEAILPVPDTVRHWHASPRAAVGFLKHAAGLDASRLEGRTALNMPGVSCTIAEQIEALRQFAGNDVTALIRHQPDPQIMAIVEGWPRDFTPTRALGLGFSAESSFDEIIRIYAQDDMPANTS